MVKHRLKNRHIYQAYKEAMHRRCKEAVEKLGPPPQLGPDAIAERVTEDYCMGYLDARKTTLGFDPLPFVNLTGPPEVLEQMRRVLKMTGMGQVVVGDRDEWGGADAVWELRGSDCKLMLQFMDDHCYSKREQARRFVARLRTDA